MKPLKRRMEITQQGEDKINCSELSKTMDRSIFIPKGFPQRLRLYQYMKVAFTGTRADSRAYLHGDAELQNVFPLFLSLGPKPFKIVEQTMQTCWSLSSNPIFE